MPVCRSCRRPILWAITANGHRAPVDSVPVPAGNLRLSRTQAGVTRRVELLVGVELERARSAGERLYLSHFATCPDAAAHRV